MRLPSTPALAALVLALACACSSSPSAPAEAMGADDAPDETADAAPTSEGANAPDAADPVAGADAPALRTARSRAGTYTVTWRPLAPEVPRNEHFKMEVWLYRGDEPLPGADLYVSGWMPDHGHGLVVRPRSTDNGDGSYLVEGMLLHMRGLWQVFFDVIAEDGSSERTEFRLEL